MADLTFKNTYINNNYNSQMQSSTAQRMTTNENFTAIDKEKLKEDSIELANKAQEQVKENWITKTLKNLGVQDPQKTIKSLVLTLVTIVGVAFIGNKTVDKMAKAGLSADDILNKSKLYQGISNKFSKAKNSVVNFLCKSKTLNDVKNALTVNKAKPRCDMTRGYGRGFVSIFSLTPVDIIRKSLAKNGIKDAEAFQVFEKLVGTSDNSKLAKELAESLTGGGLDNREFCSKLSQGIRNYIGCGNDNKKFYQALLNLKKTGKLNGQYVGDLFNDIKMSEKGLGAVFGSWWPVNIVDSIGKKIRGDKWKGFCRGNLGDSLIKFNAVNGTLADTKIGSLVQKSILVPAESISNFVNDKSGFGVMLCTTIMSLYNNVQDAPKEKRVATIADDYIGTIGSIAISTPAAFAATYGLASLKNLEGKTFFSKILKVVGKFFGMGLYNVKNGVPTVTPKSFKNFVPRFAGGALRFFLVMFAFAPLFSKPIRAIIHKIFGKPYDKAEEERNKQIEAQKNTVIPELGITQGQLLEKIQKNPQVINRLQTDAELIKALDKNPKIILDLLDGKDVSAQIQQANKLTKDPSKIVSPMNRDLINRRTTNVKPVNPQAMGLNKQKSAEKTPQQNKEEIKDTAVYIPSSEFTAKSSTISQEQQQELNNAMTRADKALQRAEKYI